MFGREDKGLPEELLKKNIESCLRIPMRNELRSLNLSNSVAIAVYEVLRQWDYPDLSREGKLAHFKKDKNGEYRFFNKNDWIEYFEKKVGESK